jgi:hypothetical protein
MLKTASIPAEKYAILAISFYKNKIYKNNKNCKRRKLLASGIGRRNINQF